MKAHTLRHHLYVLRDAGADLPHLIVDPYDGHLHTPGCTDRSQHTVEYLDEELDERSVLYSFDRHVTCIGCSTALAEDADERERYLWIRRLDEVVEIGEALDVLATKFLSGNRLRRFTFSYDEQLSDTMETYAETDTRLQADPTTGRHPLVDVMVRRNPTVPLLGEYVSEMLDDLTRQWSRLKQLRPAASFALRGKPLTPRPQVLITAAWVAQDERMFSRYKATGIAEGLQAEATVLARHGEWVVIDWDARFRWGAPPTADTAAAGDYTRAELEQAAHLWAQDPDNAGFETLLSAVHAAYA